MSVAGSALPGIEAGRVERWLAEHVDGLASPVEFGLVSGGRSNLTYRLTDAAGVTYALRRPPTGGVLSTAHDVSREWRFISALAPTAVPVPPPVAYCADSTVTGAEFYVMGFVEGLVLADSEAGLALAPQARASAAEHLVDVLVALHALDPAVIGLGEMVRKTGYLERQLRRWHAQVHATDAPELALLDEVHDLLARRIPAQSSGIVHGDYRAGNVAFGPDGAVRAVFDWELATSGDPMADLGWLASTWQDPGEQLPPATPGPSAVAGFPARAQLVQRYARLSGRDVSNLPYWVAFSRWRSACIGVGVRARYLAGHMADDGYAARLLTSAENPDPGAAGGRVVLAEAARDALRAAGLLLRDVGLNICGRRARPCRGSSIRHNETTRTFAAFPPRQLLSRQRQGVRAWRGISPLTPSSRRSSTGSSVSARKRSSRSITSSPTRCDGQTRW